jgi:hypothetical protein
MKGVADRRGATFADVLVFLATLTLAGALLYPVWSAREFRARVSTAIADVETVRGTARRSLELSGRWPDAAPPGQLPPELAPPADEGGAFTPTDYRVGWTSWNVVDSVEVPQPIDLEDEPIEAIGPVLAPAPRSIGGVTVHSSDAALLAELSQHFLGEPNFVLDTMWLLVLPERAAEPITER